MNTAKTVMRQEKRENNRIISIVLALFFIGAVFVFSSSSAGLIMNGSEDTSVFFKKQLIFGFISLIIGVVIYKTPLKTIINNLSVIQIFTIALMLSVFVIGKEVNGNKNWLQLGPLSMQPAEFAKITLILLTAKIIGNGDVNNKDTLKKLLYTVGPIVLIVVAQKDLGTAIIMGAIVLVMMYMSGLHPKTLMILIGIGLAGILALSIASPYRIKRMLIFADPFSDYYGMGYQIVQSLYAVSNGGLLGQGIGNSIHKYGFLPENHTDFIFAVVAEELGFVGATLVILLFLLLIVSMLRIAFKLKNKQLSLTASGIASFIAIESLLNLGVVVSLMPVTGVTLPFISYGGSSLMSKMICVALLLNINKSSRKTNAEELDKEIYESSMKRNHTNTMIRKNTGSFVRNTYTRTMNFSNNLMSNGKNTINNTAKKVINALMTSKDKLSNVKLNKNESNKFNRNKKTSFKTDKNSKFKTMNQNQYDMNLQKINLNGVLFNKENINSKKNVNEHMNNLNTEENLKEIDLSNIDIRKFNQ